MMQKTRDLKAATTVAQRIVSASKGSTDVEAYFPRLSERFGLKHIGWSDMGTPGASLDIQVNPKAQIDASTLMLNKGTVTGHDLQEVNFASNTLGGSTVGVHMRAAPIGPSHPQGGPPSSGALSTLMAKLPTDPTLPAKDKYIKGHLLNDNLGGPGTADNLFPITAQANKEHEAQVESYAKKAVNQYGQWVNYEVKVVDKGSDLTKAPKHNWVNADLQCSMIPLMANGQPGGSGGLSRTIQSRSGTKAGAVDHGYTATGLSTLKDKNFDEDKVEWSTAKGDPAAEQVLDPSIATERLVFISRLDSFGFTPSKQRALLGEYIVDINKIQAHSILDPDYDLQAAMGDTLIGAHDNPAVPIGQWNKAIGALNKKASDISGLLMEMGISMGMKNASLAPSDRDPGGRAYLATLKASISATKLKLR